MQYYPAVMMVDEDGYYYVDFPDLECCFTQGENFDDACFMAQDILDEWMKDNKYYPKASKIEILKDKHPEAIIKLFGCEKQ